MSKARLASSLLVAVPVLLGANAAPAGTAAALEVRVVTVLPVTTGTWDRQNHEAYTAAAQALGWHLEVAQAVSPDKVAGVLAGWGAQHVDIVFSTNVGFQSALLAAAERYSETLWVTLGELSTTGNLPNVASYAYDTCAFGVLQGAAAALASRTHTIGAVASIRTGIATNILAGVRYGAKLAVPATHVLVRYSGDFVSAPHAQQAAAALLAKGADVVLPVTQSLVSGRIAARVQRGHGRYVGAYADESAAAPKAVVTSVVVDFRKAYEQVGRQRASGAFKPGLFTGGVADGFVKVLPFRLGLAREAARAQALAARAARIPGCTR